MRYRLAGIAVGLSAIVLLVAVVAPLRAGADTKLAAFSPPPDSAIPAGEFGDMIKLGKAIFDDTKGNAGAYVGNGLRCANCHLDSGRLANAGPLAQGYVTYPQFRKKTHKVDTYEDRLRDCFRYSMNGASPPRGDKVLVALESYAFFLAKGAPVGVEMPGQGYPKLPKPAQGLDFARGEKIFAAKCAMCHGAVGSGMPGVAPPLWGPDSFNWGAGMGRIDKAAGFIKANMPFGNGNSLTDQEAWDVASFVDSHERPQDPRYADSVAATRKANHDTPMSMYGQSVNGVILGTRSWPSGIQAGGAKPVQGQFD